MSYNAGFSHAAGIVGFLTTGNSNAVIPRNSNDSQMTDVTVNNALIVGGAQVAGLSGRTSTANTPKIDLKNCYAENNITFGEQHISSLASSIVKINTADRCYSVGSIVISTAGHSGGLFSCGSDFERLSNCFVDAEVYGNKTTGVFIGNILGAPSRIVSCFASGYVEGQEDMGGFIGSVINYNTAFYDCYSTALVGLRSNGQNIGGFLGRKENKSGNGAMPIKNCYAAGETGFTGLDCSAASTQPSALLIGGMAGSVRNDAGSLRDTFEACYYDKQTTAMREWDLGQDRGKYAGVTGVLTADSVQNGAGLTNTDPLNATSGFKGLTANTKAIAGAYPVDPGVIWDYSEPQHYPELAVFKNAAAAQWGTEARADLVKAYSLSSTATMQLNPWDYTLNRGSGLINVDAPGNKDIYDTVRDLTSGFSLTSHKVDNWDRIGNQDSRTHGESKSVIAGETYDVLSLKSQNGQFLCDELVPGIEWLMATCSVGGQTATRRVRVIPTASVDAGQSKVVTGLYDHADDVRLFYSTGARYEANNADVTTGVYPDKDGQANAISTVQAKMLANPKNTYAAADTESGNDLFFGADAGYMGKSGENAEGSKLYVYIHKVTGFDPQTNEIQMGDRVTLTDTNQSLGAEQFNGYTLLDDVDQRYLINYMWELGDGRVLEDAKLVRRAQTPFNVTLNLYQNSLSPATLYPEGGYLYTGVDAPGGSRPRLTSLGDIVAKGRQAETDANAAQYLEKAQTAWKLKNPADSLINLQLTMQNGDPAMSGGDVFTTAITDPVAGGRLALPCVYYRIVYRNGVFFTIPEAVTRSYTLQYDAASAVWYLEFDKLSEVSPENNTVYFNDVENHIRVDVVVKHSQNGSGAPQTGDAFEPWLWMIAMLLSAVTLGALMARRRVRNARG